NIWGGGKRGGVGVIKLTWEIFVGLECLFGSVSNWSDEVGGDGFRVILLRWFGIMGCNFKLML
ncbi:hypothetical protein, partial [Staphylococcus saprophyticus]|uniref:hypothetical protein n=1 Tax=Staphylococcus saprophyticus TaxID=29385 RepID=UPI001C92F2EF